MPSNQTYAHRKACGLCTHCGTCPPGPMVLLCAHCRTRANQAKAAWAQTHLTEVRAATARSRGERALAPGPNRVACCGQWWEIDRVPLTVACCGTTYFQEVSDGLAS